MFQTGTESWCPRNGKLWTLFWSQTCLFWLGLLFYFKHSWEAFAESKCAELRFNRSKRIKRTQAQIRFCVLLLTSNTNWERNSSFDFFYLPLVFNPFRHIDGEQFGTQIFAFGRELLWVWDTAGNKWASGMRVSLIGHWAKANRAESTFPPSILVAELSPNAPLGVIKIESCMLQDILQGLQQLN